MIIYAIIFIYLLIGYIIWRLATYSMGGKQGYYEYLEENYDHPKSIIVFSEIMVIVFWPYFIIKSIIGGIIHEDTE